MLISIGSIQSSSTRAAEEKPASWSATTFALRWRAHINITYLHILMSRLLPLPTRNQGSTSSRKLLSLDIQIRPTLALEGRGFASPWPPLGPLRSV